MIEYIKGEITELTPAQMIMETGGVGYAINISLTTFSDFQGKQEGKVYIYEVIREDAHLLYGFSDKVERELFLLLTSVSGVGPNTARMILSSLKPSELVGVIEEKNETALTSVKGIGLKTAQRILVDLKGKMKNLDLLPSSSSVTIPNFVSNAVVADEAVAALVMLGFQKAASQKVVAKILKAEPQAAVEQVIKVALKEL